VPPFSFLNDGNNPEFAKNASLLTSCHPSEIPVSIVFSTNKHRKLATQLQRQFSEVRIMPVELMERGHTSGTLVLDLRKIAPPERHFRVFQAFEAIKDQDDFCIVCDTDLFPLKRQFDLEMTDRFEWKELKGGPDFWEVLIVKKGK
jgi:uncharacterized protein (DUF2249 family)